MPTDKNCDKMGAFELYMNNVTRIPLLDEITERKLLEEYSKGNMGARNKLIESNLRLVVSIANEIKRIFNTNTPLLDIIQVGNIGLIKAIDNFDLSMDNRLSTYASRVIKTNIQQYIYNNSTTFKTSMQFVRDARVFFHKLNELRAKTGKTYSTSELAKLLNIDEATIIQFFQFSTRHISLDEKINDEVDDTILNFIIDNNSIDPEINAIDNEINNNLLIQINSVLSKKEQDIILLRFGFTDGEYHTLEEVGKQYGLTRERIRQIEAKAIKKLRSQNSLKYLK